jgi:Holliday junction resolvasome RuvABC endonuclease subunit
MSNEVVVVGIDQSARGTAAVALRDGKLDDLLFWADTKKDYKAFRGKGLFGACIEPLTGKNADGEAGKVRRLSLIRHHLATFLERTSPSHVAIEGYLVTRTAITSRVLGEVGATVRLTIADAQKPYRTYPVQLVKSYATGSGAAEKAEMVLACRDQWEQINWLAYGTVKGAAGNLADAYVIAQLLWLELRVRSGRTIADELTPPERSILNHTTPKSPMSILETPFVTIRSTE